MREIKFRALDAVDCNWVYYGTAITGTVDHLQLRSDTESQYTGMKDKNGVEIYEGDIVTHDFYPNINKVFYYDEDAYSFQCSLSNSVYDQEFGIDQNCIQVIGNIHENPELMEWV